MSLPYKKGSNGPEIKTWQDWAYRYAKSYANLIGPKDAYFGNGEELFVKTMQGKLGVAQTGIFGALEAGLTGFKTGSVVISPPVIERRKIWFYSNPGSGANEFVGPSFEVGEFCKNVLKINHQPVHSAIGGYLGALGGDSKLSYNEVIFDQYKSIEWLLDNNPDINDPDLELWFSGYSQKADGLEDALEILFGDGGFVIPQTGEKVGPGKYRHLRGRINGVIQFGNPSKETTGIARKQRPAWLRSLIRNVTTKGDFYAEAPDNIRPIFYQVIVDSESELPFFVRVLRIAVPILIKWAATILPIFIPLATAGGFGPMVQIALSTLSGLQGLGSNPLFGSLMGQAGNDGNAEEDRRMIELLSPTGVLTNIPGLIQLIAALPGLQAHGEYHLPKSEFNGRTGIQVGCDIVAAFRR